MNNLFYNLTRVLSYNKYFNILCGSRGHGKTYSVKDRIIKESLRDKVCRGMWVRRYSEDFQSQSQAVKKQILADWLPNNKELAEQYKFVIKGEQIHAINDKEDIIVMEFVALNEYERAKSVPRPETRYIAYDEFLTRGTYLRNEPFCIADLASSVFRHNRRGKRIIMMSNTLSTSNPHFDAIGVTAKDFNKEFIVPIKSTVIHYDVFDERWKEHMRKDEEDFVLYPNLHYEEYERGETFLNDRNEGVIDIKGLELKQTPFTILTVLNDETINIAIDKHKENYICYETLRESSYSDQVEFVALGYKEVSRKLIEVFKNQFLAGRMKFGSLRAKLAMFNLFACIDARFMIE